MKGKDNSFKDVTVQRQNVADALDWLINNSPYYKDIIVNNDSLNSLPLHGVPQDLLSIQTENLENSEASEPDLGPQNEEDIVYNESTEMSSFLFLNVNSKKFKLYNHNCVTSLHLCLGQQ